MRSTVLALALFFSLAAAAQEWSPPKQATPPKSFLRKVPLGIGKAEIATVMGVPAKQLELNGQLLWQYDITYNSNQVASYVFVLESDTLVDVRYSYGRRAYSAIEEQRVR